MKTEWDENAEKALASFRKVDKTPQEKATTTWGVVTGFGALIGANSAVLPMQPSNVPTLAQLTESQRELLDLYYKRGKAYQAYGRFASIEPGDVKIPYNDRLARAATEEDFFNAQVSYREKQSTNAPNALFPPSIIAHIQKTDAICEKPYQDLYTRYVDDRKDRQQDGPFAFAVTNAFYDKVTLSRQCLQSYEARDKAHAAYKAHPTDEEAKTLVKAHESYILLEDYAPTTHAKNNKIYSTLFKETTDLTLLKAIKTVKDETIQALRKKRDGYIEGFNSRDPAGLTLLTKCNGAMAELQQYYDSWGDHPATEDIRAANALAESLIVAVKVKHQAFYKERNAAFTTYEASKNQGLSDDKRDEALKKCVMLYDELESIKTFFPQYAPVGTLPPEREDKLTVAVCRYKRNKAWEAYSEPDLLSEKDPVFAREAQQYNAQIMKIYEKYKWAIEPEDLAMQGVLTGSWPSPPATGHAVTSPSGPDRSPLPLQSQSPAVEGGKGRGSRNKGMIPK